MEATNQASENISPRGREILRDSQVSANGSCVIFTSFSPFIYLFLCLSIPFYPARLTDEISWLESVGESYFSGQNDCIFQ